MGWQRGEFTRTDRRPKKIYSAFRLDCRTGMPRGLLPLRGGSLPERGPGRDGGRIDGLDRSAMLRGGAFHLFVLRRGRHIGVVAPPDLYPDRTVRCLYALPATLKRIPLHRVMPNPEGRRFREQKVCQVLSLLYR